MTDLDGLLNSAGRQAVDRAVKAEAELREALAECAKWLSPGNENVTRGYLVACIRDLAQTSIANAANATTAEADVVRLKHLIWRVATGDGQQIENVSMSAEEWVTRAGEDDYVEIAITPEQWCELLREAGGPNLVHPQAVARG